MAVMVTFTLKTDVATYQRLHVPMLKMAMAAGMLFHTGREIGSHIGIIDIWPSDAAWNAFASGPLAEGMKAAGIAAPDDLKVTTLLNADGR